MAQQKRVRLRVVGVGGVGVGGDRGGYPLTRLPKKHGYTNMPNRSVSA